MTELGKATFYDSEENYLNNIHPQDTPESCLKRQEGGDHYKSMGEYQPWQVLHSWLNPEEFKGYMVGTAIAYLAREKQKGGLLDIKKACHTLQALIEFMEKK